jgi:hypothetical protein
LLDPPGSGSHDPVRLLAWASRIPAMPELVGPVPLVAAAVLALNDHVLKARFPGLVTGKLSDLAAAFVLPLFVSAALALATRWPLRRRLGVGVAVTALLLAALKLSPAAAGAVVAGLDALRAPLGVGRGRIIADPTDLVALPFAFAAWAYGLQAGRKGREARP